MTLSKHFNKTLFKNSKRVGFITIAIISMFFAACGGGNDNSDKKDRQYPTIPTYSVSFFTNGGSSVTARSVPEGDVVSEPNPAPTRIGYDFDGWYTDNNTFVQPVPFPYTVTRNVTLYAKWKPHVYIFTIYDIDNLPVQTENVEHGDTISEPSQMTTREGYDFDWWYGNSERTIRVTFPYPVTGPVNLYEKWSIKKYTVTFNSGDGNPERSIQVEHGGVIDEPEPTREGYDFSGWYSNPERTVPVTLPLTVTGPVSLYVKWKDVPLVTSITISPNEIELDQEQGKKLTATCAGVGDFYCSVIWKSSDINVATVNNEGLVTAVRDGVAYINAAWSEDYTVISPEVKITVTDPNTGVFLSALKAIPMAADPSGAKPKVLDAYTHGGQNYFLIDAGQIANTYISSVIPPVYYPGFGTPTYSRTTLTEQTITEAVTETVSNSITMTESKGTSLDIKAFLTVRLGSQAKYAEFGASINRTWNWSSSESGTNSTTHQTSVSEANKFAETQSTSLTLSPGTPVGYHRIAMYALSNIYLIVTTTIDNQELLDCEVVVSASGSFNVRQEFSPDGIFDNTPISGTDLIDFADDFYRDLKLDLVTKVFDFSNAIPNQASTIASDIQMAVFVGQYDKRTTFNNYNIVVAGRGGFPLIIEFENFGMKAGANTVAINSASEADITINFKGNNSISGGNASAAATGSGQNGRNGSDAIFTNGRLTLTGGGSADIMGGSGTVGRAGTGYTYDANSNKAQGLHGGNGGIGGNGGNGVSAASLSVLTVLDKVKIIGGDGANGANGGQGEGVQGPGRATAGRGGDAGGGGSGGHGVYLQEIFSINLKQIESLQIMGGNGGTGGGGGRGGRGYSNAGDTRDNGGNGGSGGNGGNGGTGIYFRNESGLASGSMPSDNASVQGGRGGNGGKGGNGGAAIYTAGWGQSGHGSNGIGGSGGNAGNGGNALRIINTPTVLLRLLASDGGIGGLRGDDGDGKGNEVSTPNNPNENGKNGASGLLQAW